MEHGVLPRGSGITCAAYTLESLNPRLHRADLLHNHQFISTPPATRPPFSPDTAFLLPDQQSPAVPAKVEP